jgi:peptidoglycan/LPS O-acetylase OafA/YrhL
MSRLTYVDGLRGLAIALVILRHYYQHAYEYGLPRWADVFSFGGVGVHLFLLLSGLCIGYRYVGPKAKAFQFGDFWKRRLQRLLPAYYVVMLFCLFFQFHGTSTAFLTQLLTHALMIHNLNPQTVLALNMPFWSLALEAQLYLLFPLFLRMQQRWGGLAMLCIVLLAQLFYRSLFIGMNSREVGSWAFVLPWGVLGRMFEFALGMMVAVRLQEGKLPSPRTTKLLYVAMPLLLGTAYFSGSRLDILHPLTDLCWSLSFLCLLLLATVNKSLVQRFFAWKPLVFLGQMSYSVYLTHEIFMGYLFHYWRTSLPPPIYLLIPVVGIVLAASYIFYRLIEKPAIDFFARATKPKVATGNLVL